tara:strand:- start:260 stop:754 length:495 start_codon:yes stop_codon:yes gene_type:complete
MLVGLIIVLEDGFPIIFRQKRIGLNNNHFLIFKFRTMKKNTPDIPTHLMDKNIPYTRIGPYIRKYSLDELPQLVNIVRGEIKFIGPRPALYNQKDLIKMRTEKNIHTLLPGITGWAQVNGRDELSMAQKVELDYFYLKNISFRLNVFILWLTILKVIKAEDVSI